MSAEAEVKFIHAKFSDVVVCCIGRAVGTGGLSAGRAMDFFEQYLLWLGGCRSCARSSHAGAVPTALPSPVCEANSKRTAAKSFIIVLGLLYWFAGVLQEANPLWRAASFGLAVSAVVITLLLVYLAGGAGWVRQFLFPAVFFLDRGSVAHGGAKGALFETLTRLDTSVVVEMLGFVGIPAAAIMHGNRNRTGLATVPWVWRRRAVGSGRCRRR